LSKFIGYKKGIDLGGWISQCKEYTKEHFDSFIKPEDFDRIASWELDHVRLPVDYNVLEDGYEECTSIGFDYIDMAVRECERVGLKLIIDLHKTAGFSFYTGYGEGGFFDTESLQERFYVLWESIANRYGKYSDRVSFELLNEVTSEEFAKPWNAIAHKCIERIRAIAPDTYILIGGVWSNGVDAVPLLDPPYDDKIVYNFHCYEPLIFTHQAAYWVDGMPSDLTVPYPATGEEYAAIIAEKAPSVQFGTRNIGEKLYSPEFFADIFAPAVKYAAKYDVPLYCGEYGVIDKAQNKDILAWYKDIYSAFEKYGIARAAWNYKEMDFGMTDERLADIFDELKKYF